MKRIGLYLGVLAAMGLVSACLSEPENFEPVVPEGERLPVELYNEIHQVVATRVNDSGFCDGDGVGVYVVNYVDGQPGTMVLDGNQADNVRYVYHEAEGRWVPDAEVYFRDKKTHVDIIGYYPYANPTSVTEYPFEVAKDQSTDAANGLLGGYESSDFLWGKAGDVAPVASRIPLNFKHQMAGVLVTLEEGTGFADGEFATLEKAVLVSNTIRKSTIDLATGIVTPQGEVPSTGIIPFRDNENFRAVVVPQTIPASTALFNITVDNMNYVFRKQADFEYIGGKLHKFTVEISKKEGSGLTFKVLGESITAWETDNVTHDATAREYIVIHCETPGGLKDAIIVAGKDITKVKNLKVTGTVDARDFYMMRDEMTKLQSINMKEVTIAEYIENGYNYGGANEIPNDAFLSKSSLIRFIFPDSITKIGGCAFQDTNLSGSLIIPNGVTEIAAYTFTGCSSLTGTLSLPNSLKIIDSYAFQSCSGFVGNLDIPASVTYIGGSAFRSCSGFTGELVLPENLEFLGEYAFDGCDGFTGSLEIPKQITIIEKGIFMNCSGFNGILILPKGLIEIRSDAFFYCNFRGSLALPENLLIIGDRAFERNLFSGKLVLPPSLSIIKASAFSGCSSLTGVVEIPKGIISIAPATFSGCRQLEGVILPNELESIREYAFSGCYQLNSVTCKAQTPPMVSSSAFDGVAKDNFTVEVPELSVNDYITAPGWNEFKRFAAHREFSISRNLFRTLNAEDSKTVIMRALSGESWSVESKPDWVTVTPSSGVGKVEVTITVAEQPKGAGFREGEVVFLLDGKDYRSTTRVEQYDYEYGDGDVITVQEATRGNGVNLVFMGDCFDAKDISEGKYLDGVNEAIGYYFDIEPYKSYRDYFNVYVVFGLSPDSGVGSVNTIREAKFGSSYTLGTGIEPDMATCFEYACKTPTVTESNINQTLITLIENTEDYGGITYMYGDNSAIAVCPMSRDYYPYDFRGLVQHEAGGHGFGKLGDEYIYNNSFIQTCLCYEGFLDGKARGWYENLHDVGNMYEVPWAHLIFDEKYSNVVDLYEGGYTHTRGVFRSEPNSCMNNNIPYYSAISRESIVKRIMAYAGEEYSFETFKEKDVMTAESPSTKTDMLYDWTFGYSNKQHAPVYMGEKPVFNSK